jgi:Tfp pilus assembly protein PilO
MNSLMSSRKHLLALAIGLSLAILVGGYFLLISPKQKQVSDLRAQVTTQESSNSSLRSQVQMLQELQAKLPQQQAALAKMQSKVPNSPALPDLLRALNKAADDSGVKLTGITPTAPSAVAGANGVSGIDVAVKATGDYVALEQYQLALEGLSRAFLVNGMTIAEGAGAGGSSSTASTSAATTSTTGGGTELSATINGRVLLQTAPSTAGTTTASGSASGTTTG